MRILCVTTYFPLPQEFVRSDDCFILRVRGDSMIDAGIFDGDMLVVRRQPTAKDRDIVVARIEDEATVKRFFREDGRIRLQPENQRMEPIYARDIAIEGVALAVIHRLN